MESMTFNFNLDGKRIDGERVVCGVVGSGNLEVIVQDNHSLQIDFFIQTAIDHYQSIWARVIEDFVSECKPIGLKFTLNDNGATPPVVSLRLKQALELFKGYQRAHENYLELGARERISAIVDKNSFKEWLSEPHYSPHLAILALPGEADDGVVIGSAQFAQKKIAIAAQQKDFMGGAVGEIHGAKLTAIFKAAIHLKMDAVILLIDSGGVRLHEANAGELAISETIRAIFAARNSGIMTIGVVCGKNGAFGGMGILASCLDYLIIDEIGRIGVSGPEVIAAVKGVEAFDAADRALVWRVYGGKTRFLQKIAASYVDANIDTIKNAITVALNKQKPLDLLTLKKEHAQLKTRLEKTAGFAEEGAFLSKTNPDFSTTIFEMNKEQFLQTVTIINERARS